MKKISIPHLVEFMAISSYGAGARESTGDVRVTLDLQINIRDKHVLLVEDIIDSGNTLAAVIERLSVHHPKSIEGFAPFSINPPAEKWMFPSNIAASTSKINLSLAMGWI